MKSFPPAVEWHLSYGVLLGSRQQDERSSERNDLAIVMILLHVALQDGFSNDTVVVWLDDREIYRKDGVSTRTQISRADSFEFESLSPQATVKVALPARDLSCSVPVDLSRTPYLGVSITPEGEIAHKLQSEPFGYV